MLPASLAAWVPVFIATPTSAWASAGASLVPSPVIATRLPPACSRLISAILSSGVASARKSSTPASVGDRRRGERVVAGDHHGADAHRPQLVEALAHARLHGVLEPDHAEHPPRADAPALVDDDQRRGAVARDAARRSGRARAARGRPRPRRTGAPSRRRPCAPCRPVGQVHAGHAGLGGERHQHGARVLDGHEPERRARRARRSSGPRASRRRATTPARPRRARRSVDAVRPG